MLDTTLVVWLTDFGRTPQINSASGRDHWASAGFIVMAGAGVPGGAVLGATDDEGGKVIRDEYLTEDIAATIYAKLGLPADLTVTSPDGRPIRLVEGRVIKGVRSRSALCFRKAGRQKCLPHRTPRHLLADLWARHSCLAHTRRS